MLALYAAALDRRIGAAYVSGYFGGRDNMWDQPIDRNVFGLVEQFGDAEVAAMIAAARLIIEHGTRARTSRCRAKGGAQAGWRYCPPRSVKAEYDRRIEIARGRTSPAPGRVQTDIRRLDRIQRPHSATSSVTWTVRG